MYQEDDDKIICPYCGEWNESPVNRPEVDSGVNYCCHCCKYYAWMDVSEVIVKFKTYKITEHKEK